MDTEALRVGVVSTRLAGTDGVSLEAAKWTHVLHDLGHTCFFFAGESDRPPDRSRVVREAHFRHRQVMQVNQDLFDNPTRSIETTEMIHALRVKLKQELYRFISDFDIQLLKVENALSLPMNVPLGLALTEIITETNIPTIAHHHDFHWERDRFAVTAANDFLHAAFPPAIPGICHVVINSYAAAELARRTGMRSMLIPNVMDFDHFPDANGTHRDEIRQALQLDNDEVFLLQPTRIVPRKCIERSIEFTKWLGLPASLVISHSSGDEGNQYAAYLKRLADAMGVRLIFGADTFNYTAGTREDGRQVFSLAEAYFCSDLVTYPSRVEGFGNAFLESIYYRRPLMISGYEIYRRDIEPKGFQVIDMGGFVTESCLEQARELLGHPGRITELTSSNYELGRRYYSLHVLRDQIASLLQQRFHEM